MIWKLLTALGVAFLAGGIAQYARLLTAKKLPKWIVPAAAGLGILGYQIYMEYSWFDRTQQQLPLGSLVTEVRKTPVFWRPWTFIVPIETGFSVLEPEKTQIAYSNGDKITRFQLYSFEQAFVDYVNNTKYLLNCSNSQLVPLNDNGQAQIDQTMLLDRQTKLYQTLCN